MFKKSIVETIKDRHSWRDYSSKQIEPEKLEILKKVFKGLQPPFGNIPVFDIVEISDGPEIKKLGTYGFIKGAKLFISGKIKQSPLCWEDYGWWMENIILLATEIGLSTCWLGGTFNRKNFGEKLNLAEDESIPAISPVGYGEEKRSLRDMVIRWGAGSHKRKAWELLFFEEDFSTPLAEDAGIYTLPLAMLRLAPSASNKQPWRIVKQKECFHFYVRRTLGYNQFFGVDLQQIDMGIAMLHFELTCKEQGLNGKWEIKNPALQNVQENTEYIVSWIY